MCVKITILHKLEVCASGNGLDLTKTIVLKVHCFTGTASEAREFLDHGLYIGITGW